VESLTRVEWRIVRIGLFLLFFASFIEFVLIDVLGSLVPIFRVVMTYWG
jgi:hypothetical protein